MATGHDQQGRNTFIGPPQDDAERDQAGQRQPDDEEE